MTQATLHLASTRGQADHGWLQARHSFSFAGYYDPKRNNFGALRVLNDDIIAAGMGFGMHPHDNMEIVTIPLQGALQHKDSMGNTAIINTGDLQVMSAGTGVQHSEYNPSGTDEVRLLQIWLLPNKRNVEPRYDQVTLNIDKDRNYLHQIISPSSTDAGTWIHQDAWFYMGTFDANTTSDYVLKKTSNGIYVFVIKGSFQVADHVLGERDALGMWDGTSTTIKSITDESKILIIEVPM
jgi:quercetin 2,3-dioxygenase